MTLRFVARLVCKLKGHDYGYVSPAHQRHCRRRCGAKDACLCWGRGKVWTR